MTERLYYRDSFLYEFEAEVVGVSATGDRMAVTLDRTAFYPTSGGQVFDTGLMVVNGSDNVRVVEVADAEDGTILHYVEGGAVGKGSRIRGLIDAERRRDHMQQHSGQHVLSAAFIRLFDIPTVSFHMGDDYCSIDLDTKTLTAQQVEKAETLANEVILENHGVEIKFVSQEEARGLGLRKLPPAEKDELRLIDIHDFDLTACGGTHVRSTGQIGAILLRKTEKVKQGWRVEFVCGQRAVKTARHDYTTLAEAAGLYSSHLWDLPEQIRKSQEETRGLRKSRERAMQELAELTANPVLAEAPETNGRKVIVKVFADRDLNFIKLLAQKITRQAPNAIVLLGATAPPAALVFAASPGQTADMNALMKEALEKLGGRGGGSKDMAQGGPQRIEGMETVLEDLAQRLRSL